MNNGMYGNMDFEFEVACPACGEKIRQSPDNMYGEACICPKCKAAVPFFAGCFLFDQDMPTMAPEDISPWPDEDKSRGRRH